MEAVDAEIVPIQDTSLGHAMTLWSQDSFRNRDYRLSHEQIAKHPVTFEKPVYDNRRFIVVVSWLVNFDIAHFSEIWFVKDLVHTFTYPVAFLPKQNIANDGGPIFVSIVKNRCQFFFSEWFM